MGFNLSGLRVPEEVDTPNLTISPDGRWLARTVFEGLVGRIHIRPIDRDVSRVLEGTENARAELFWSPDSRSIGYFADQRLMVIGIDGSPPQVRCDLPPGWHVGSWSTNGTILVEITESQEADGIYRLEPGARALELERPIEEMRGDPDKSWPTFLPDGEHYLLTQQVEGVAHLVLARLGQPEVRPLMPSHTRGSYSATGHVLFAREAALLAQPFDAVALRATGEAQMVAERIGVFGPTGEASFSLSDNGILVYGKSDPPTRLVWRDAGGVEIGSLPEEGVLRDVALSRDGSRVAFQRVDPRTGSSDLWIHDHLRGASTRLTSARRGEYSPGWSPEGDRVVFAADWSGPPNLYVKTVGATQATELLAFDGIVQWSPVWSPDGRFVVYSYRVSLQSQDIYMLPVEGSGIEPAVPTPLVTSCPERGSTRFGKRQAQNARPVFRLCQAMARPLRYVPPDSLIEITCRTIQGRFLLRPSRDLSEIVLGILGRAARRYDVKLCAFVYLSNHCHLLLRAADACQLARFMGFVNGNLAREVGRLHRWRERIWGRRYTAIVVSHEEAAQVARLRYILEQGTKEGLVRGPRDWPGASSVQALLDGRPLRGIWFDRTQEYEARRCGHRPDKYEFAEGEALELSPIPAWDTVDLDTRRETVRGLVLEIEREARQASKASGRAPLGVRRILRQDPHDRPEQTHRSPAPRFHAQAWRVRKSLELAYYEFRLRFRQAAGELKAGKQGVEFPAGCFPPPLPFARGRPLASL